MKKRIIILLIVVAAAFGVKQYLKLASDGTALEQVEQKRGGMGQLLEEREVSDGEVVFYIRQEGERAPVVFADYVKKSFLGWKWVVGGGHSVPAASGTETAWSHQYMAATKGTLNQSPFPLVFGTVDNPAIVTITVKSLQTGQETQAEINQTKNTARLWYAFVPEEQGKSFELTGFSGTGEIISVKRMNK